MTIPKENNYHFFAKDGQKIEARSLRPADAPLLVDIYEHMTAESRYRRFHQTLDHIPDSRIWQEAQNIAQADSAHNRGLIAFIQCPDGGVIPIGAVRLVETGPEEGEVAISIRDDFQNKGIGTQLMRMMVDEAQFLGYRKLVASFQNDNPAIWQVFNKLPYDIKRTAAGSYSDIVITLNNISENA